MKTIMYSSQQVTRKGIFIFLFTVLIAFNITAHVDENALEQALFNLPDVTFKKISNPGDPFLKYAMKDTV